MLPFLIWVLVVVIVAAILWQVLQRLPLPDLWRWIIVAVVAIVFLLWLLRIAGVWDSDLGYHRVP